MRRSNTFQFKEDPFKEKARGISKNHHEALLLMKFLQTKSQVKSMSKSCHSLCYTFIKNRNENDDEGLDNFDNNNEPLYDKIIMPNYDIGTKTS